MMSPYRLEGHQISIPYSQPSNNFSAVKIKDSIAFRNENENNQNYEINLPNENYHRNL